jgi:hypothetical protein
MNIDAGTLHDGGTTVTTPDPVKDVTAWRIRSFTPGGVEVEGAGTTLLARGSGLRRPAWYRMGRPSQIRIDTVGPSVRIVGQGLVVAAGTCTCRRGGSL